MPGYLICTSPRSGSTLLCRMLAATGVAGRPASLFHRPDVGVWAAALGVPDAGLAEVVQAAVERGRGGTGVFGLRMQRQSFGFFVEQLGVLYPGLGERARIERAFGPVLFVWLTRADKVAQAVSVVRATQSGLWHGGVDGSDVERTAPHREPVYDHAAIAAEVARFEGYDRDWQDWFAAEGIAPLRIGYDDLSADPQGAVAAVLGALGLDPGAAGDVVPDVRRLADDVSREWVARYRAGCMTA